jgi:protoporphyrinogen oxidase
MAAWRAAVAGHEVMLLEREDHVGGMASSFDVAGVRVDHGSHRLHPSTDPRILAELQRLLGRDLQWRPRNGRIRLEDRWVRFPLSIPDAVRHLPPSFAAGLVRDAVVPRRAREDTFAEVVRERLGPTMLDRFYAPFARKMWGREPEDLSGEQARRRIGSSSVTAVAAKALRRERPGFWYPRHGFGQLTERLAEAAVDAGVELRLSSEVTSLDLGTDHVWSTLPLTTLARLAGGPDLQLEFRALVLVYMVCDVPRWSPWDAHYLPGAETPATRVSEPKNYRDRPEDAADRTVLCIEIPCQVGDETWESPPYDGVAVRRIPAAYPIYPAGFQAPSWEPPVVSFGRGGLFQHDNTHHAMVEGWEAASCLGPGGAWDSARWQAATQRFAAHVVED